MTGKQPGTTQELTTRQSNLSIAPSTLLIVVFLIFMAEIKRQSWTGNSSRNELKEVQTVPLISRKNNFTPQNASIAFPSHPTRLSGSVFLTRTSSVAVSCLSQVEVHDVASLAPLQTFDLSGATCMTTCPVGGGQGDLTYVATSTSVNLLKLIPIEFQVKLPCFRS